MQEKKGTVHREKMFMVSWLSSFYEPDERIMLHLSPVNWQQPPLQDFK
jgi:hypothetical protein